MNDTLKTNLKRLERLVQLRQTYVDIAEANVKQAEAEVRRLETEDKDNTGNIRETRAGIAYLQSAPGDHVKNSARYLQALELQRKLIRQFLAKANTQLAQRRGEWTEAMREEKIAAKLQERRLNQRDYKDNVAQQKSQDEAFIGSYVRKRSEKEAAQVREHEKSESPLPSGSVRRSQ